MIKKNKAFTIVELLAVMTLLATILILSYPSFSKMTKSAKSKFDNSTKVLAISAAKIYVNNNKEEIDAFFSTDSDPETKYCIPLGKLNAYEYIDIDSFINDKSDAEKKNDIMRSCVNVGKVVVNDKIKFNYELSDNDKVGNDVDYLPPILTIIKKDSGSLECNKLVRVSSKDVYDSNCQVIVQDNVDTNININESQEEKDNNIIITYTASDSSGNKSTPLKIKLIIE